MSCARPSVAYKRHRSPRHRGVGPVAGELIQPWGTCLAGTISEAACVAPGRPWTRRWLEPLRAAKSFGADAIFPVHGDPQGGSVLDPGYQPFTTKEMVDEAHAAAMMVIP